MVFGFFTRRPTVAGTTEEQDSTANDAPEVQQELPQPIPVEPTSSTEGTTSSTPVPEETKMKKPASLRKTQSKAAFAYWKEREKKLHSPAPSVTAAVATPPPPTPTPPPQELVTDPTPLYTLISSVPAQTLRSYCLAHLNPAKFPPPPSASPKSRRRKSTVPQAGNAASAIISRKTHRRSQSGTSQVEGVEEERKDDEDRLSPETLTTLTHFFRTLEPPPQLHCVRCHKGYFELENTDTSCRVPHDDDSTIVERVGVSIVGDTATYETLWGCCGKTVEGDGDQGPPDGWCYEGLHTIDTRRARFRADSTPHDDKLRDCSKLRCFNPPAYRDSDSDGESVVQAKRKRRKSMAVDEGDDGKSATSEVKRRRRNTKKVQEEDEESVVSEPKKRRTRARKAPVSPEEVQTEDDQMDVDDDKPSAPATPASPKRRGRPPKSTTTRSTKPRPKAGQASPAPQAFDAVFVEIRRSSRSPVRPSGSKLKKEVTMKNAQAEEEEEEEETQKVVPAKTPRKRGRPKKALQEVVDSSIAAENEMDG